MSAKEIGKNVTASLEREDVTGAQLITILTDMGVNVSLDQLDELEYAANNTPKRAGKKIARMIKKGMVDGDALLAQISDLALRQ